MVGETHNCKKAKATAVALAIAALEGNENPMDMDMKGIGDSPTDLDLPLPGKPDNRHAAETGAGSWQSKKAVRKPKKMPPSSPR